MAIIYSYPVVPPSGDDLLFGTDATQADKPTKNFTVQSIVDIVSSGAAGLGAVLKISSNAQDLTDPANPINQPIQNLSFITGTGSATFNSFSDGTLNITGGNLTTTGNGTFNNITGTLLTSAQPNVTSLGILTSLRIGVATPAVNLIDTSITAPGLDTSLVTEKAVVSYVATQTVDETLAETLVAGNITGGKDIIVSNDDKALIQGNATVNFQPTAGTNNLVIADDAITNSVTGTTFNINSRKFQLSREQLGGTRYLSTESTAVGANGTIILYGDDTAVVTTRGGGIDVGGTIKAGDGATNIPTYSFDSDAVTGMYKSAANQIGFSSNGQTIVKIGPESGDIALDINGKTRSASFDTDSSNGAISRFILSTDPAVPQTTPTTFGLFVPALVNNTMVPTTQAVKTYVDTVGETKTLSYKGSSAAVNLLNLKDDDIQFSTSNVNIGVTVNAVSNNVGIIDITLANDITLTGFMQADNFKTTAGTATWVTTVLDGFTKITSISDATPPLAGFVGDTSAAIIPVGGGVGSNNVQFQGNASTANSLKSTGQIAISTSAGINKGVTAPFITYTNGGTVSLVSQLLPATVTAKTLGGLVVPATGSSVLTTDTILSGIGKLQAQHNTAVTGLRFMGTWNAATNAPTLINGSGQLAAGTNSTSGTTLTDAAKNFGSAGLSVVAGDRVYNQRGDFTTVASTPAATSTTLTLTDDIFLSTNQTYSVDDTADGSATPPTANLPQGEYYVVSDPGTTNLNGITDWKVGDWALSGATNVWEKQDNTSVEGIITENTIAKGSATPGTIVDSSITDTGSLITLGDATNLGGAAGDDIKSVGSFTANENLFLKKGVGVGASDDYGTSGFYLATSGNSTTAPTWTAIPDTGVTEVDSGAGLITSPTTGITSTGSVAIDYLGTDNAILSATNISAETIALTDQIWFNDVTVGSGTANTNTLSYAPVSKLKDIINTYSWDLDVNGGTAVTIADTNQVGFNNGAGIVQTLSTKDVTTAIRYVNATSPATEKNAIEAVATETAATGDFLWFSDISPTNNVIKKATIADVVSLGDQNLTQVLAKGNDTGANIIEVNDVSGGIDFIDNAYLRIGTGNDLQIYHDGSVGSVGSVIKNTGTLPLNIWSDDTNTGVDFKIIGTGGSASYSQLKLVKGQGPELYHYRSSTSTQNLRLKTTDTGIQVIDSRTAVAPTILLQQDDGTGGGGVKSLTITQGITGASQILSPDSSLTLATSGGFQIQDAAFGYFKASIGSTIAFNPANLAGDNTVQGLSVAQSTDATAAGTLTRVYGDLQVDGNINHGGGGGGVFTGNMSFVAATAKTLFYLTRTTNGQLLFDLYLTSATQGYACKKYTVAHGFNLTPTYNKIIDSVPIANGDYVVTFTNDGIGTTGDTVKCSITATTGQDIYYSLQVGFGSTAVSISTD